MSQPLLLVEQQCSYETLVGLLKRLDFSASPSDKASESLPSPLEFLLLPPDVVHICVSYLTIEPVIHDQVTVVACSSSNGSHDLQACLNEDRNTWWSSADNTMPGGVGEEWIEFQLGPKPRRLSTISLSACREEEGRIRVKKFQLQVQRDGSWITLPKIYWLHRWAYQVQLEPVDAHSIRILCLQNCMLDNTWGTMHRYGLERHERVGIFAIRFE